MGCRHSEHRKEPRRGESDSRRDGKGSELPMTTPFLKRGILIYIQFFVSYPLLLSTIINGRYYKKISHFLEKLV